MFCFHKLHFLLVVLFEIRMVLHWQDTEMEDMALTHPHWLVVCMYITHLSSNLDTIHMELPVALSGDADIGEVSCVLCGVAASKDQLSTLFTLRVPEQTHMINFQNLVYLFK